MEQEAEVGEEVVDGEEGEEDVVEVDGEQEEEAGEVGEEEATCPCPRPMCPPPV